MADFPALPLWTDAYLADTLHLTDQQHGIYLRLLMMIWRAPHCRIPNDDEWLARRFGSVDYVREHVRPITTEFCTSTGNFLSQKRLQSERAYLQRKRVQQSARAKVRWDKEKAPCGIDAASHPSGICQTDAGSGNALSTPIAEEERLAEDSAIPANQLHNENLPLVVESNKIVDNGNSGDWSDPDRRNSFAISKLVPYINARTDEERWTIAQAAEDLNHKHHRAAVTKCLAASKRAKVGWVSPSRRAKAAK